MSPQNNYPKLHNAMWPGMVGKGPDSEPPLSLDSMIELTAAARVGNSRFDGIDLFLADPHTPIDASEDELAKLADKVCAKNLVIGSFVAPVWPATGGASAMGSASDRKLFVEVVRKACRIAQRLHELGVRTDGVIRIDSACSVDEWNADPANNSRRIVDTFKAACDVAEEYGERLAAEGEICWGGMHSWKYMVDTLEAVDRPGILGFQADMAHTLLYCLGYNAAEHRILLNDQSVKDRHALDDAMRQMTDALRPWTIDFHVAQNDATVKGSGSHDKTGKHCMPDDPDGVLDIPHHAGFWLRDSTGQLSKTCRHICWDGCMFPNEQLLNPATPESILAAMLQVRDKHGWVE